MPKQAVPVAGEAKPAANTLKQMATLLRSGDVQGAIVLAEGAKQPQSTTDLLLKWQEAYDAASDEENEDQHTRHLERCARIEAAVSVIPATTAQELAAKLLIVTSYGDFLADEPLIAEAKALVGSAWDTHTDRSGAIAMAEKPSTRTLPVEKVRSIARDLAQAMDEWMDDMGNDALWQAQILPATRSKFPIGFIDIGVGRGLDDKLFRLEADFIQAEAAAELVGKKYTAAEERYFAKKPPKPEEVPLPAELVEAYQKMTLGELLDGIRTWEQPVVNAVESHRQKNESLKGAWNAECERLKRRYRVDELENQYLALLGEGIEIARRILETRALTHDGMRLKLRVSEKCSMDVGEVLDSLAEDLARLV